MALPAPSPTNGPVFKMGLFINGFNAGASEWYYFTNNANSFDDMLAGLQPFLRARAACLNYNLTNIVGVRISDNAETNRSKLFFQQDLELPVANAKDAELPPLAWLCAGSDASGFFKRKFWFRFVDQTDDTYGAQPFPGRTTVAPGFKAVWDIWANLLVNGIPNKNIGQGPFTFLIKGYSKAAGDLQKSDVKGVDIDPATNSYRLTLAGLTTATTKDRLLIKGFRGTVIKGLNGPARMISKDTVNGVDIVTINRTPRCPGIPVVTQYGIIQRSVYKYYPITGVVLERLATKRTGRPFFVTRGRRAGGTC